MEDMKWFNFKCDHPIINWFTRFEWSSSYHILYYAIKCVYERHFFLICYCCFHLVFGCCWLCIREARVTKWYICMNAYTYSRYILMGTICLVFFSFNFNFLFLLFILIGVLMCKIHSNALISVALTWFVTSVLFCFYFLSFLYASCILIQIDHNAKAGSLMPSHAF